MSAIMWTHPMQDPNVYTESEEPRSNISSATLYVANTQKQSKLVM